MIRRHMLVWLSILAGLVLSGCANPNASERYLDSLAIEGYRKAGEGSISPGAYAAYYVGPASDEINSQVSGPPDLRIGKPSMDLTNGNTKHVGTGQGTIDETLGCQVLLFELAYQSPFVGDGELTEAEVAKIRDGSFTVYRLSVLCGSTG